MMQRASERASSMRDTFVSVARKVDRASLVSRLAPDMDGGKLLVLVAILLTEVVCIIVKLSIRFSAVQHASAGSVQTMMFIDTIKYLAIGCRNVLVVQWVVENHKGGSNGGAFTRKNMFYDSTMGRQSEIAIEVFMLFSLGAVFQSMSFAQLIDGGTCSFVDPTHPNRALPGWDVLASVDVDAMSKSKDVCVDLCTVTGLNVTTAGAVVGCAGTHTHVVALAVWAGAAYGGTATGVWVHVGQLVQFTNYLSLVAVFAPLDNAYMQIKSICQMMQIGMAVELVYDILLHMIYSTGDSQGLQGTKSAATSGSTSFHDLRIASLVAFISARLIAMRFFAFKAKHPRFVYCEQLHASVPNLEEDGEGLDGGACEKLNPVHEPTGTIDDGL